MALTFPDDGPVRLPLVVQPEQRGSSLDTDSLPRNVFIEQQPDGRVVLGRRPGYLQQSSAAVGAFGRGIYNWNGTYFAVVGGNLYKSTPPSTVWGLVGAISGGAEKIAWNQTMGTPEYLYIGTRNLGYVYDGVTLSTIADADYPGNSKDLVYGSAFLDGTLYVMDTLANIYGSGINLPLSWAGTNTVRAQIEPDRAMALAKQSIYVIAFKQWTTEAFYDAGAYAGTITGSPLLPVQNAKQPWGLFQPYSLQSINDELFWVGGNKSSNSPVVLHMQGLKIERISSPAVEKLLETYGYVTMYAHSYRLAGHTYYALAVGGSPSAPVLSVAFSLVYHIEQKLWYVWSLNDGSGIPIMEAAGGLAGNTAGITLAQSIFQTEFFAPGAEQSFDSHMYRPPISPAGPAENPILAEIVTPNFDKGTRLRKILSFLRVIADRKSGGILQVCWSDDDYTTWSPWYEINLSLLDPGIGNLGTFRRRAFWFRHAQQTLFRIESIEMDLLVGSM